MSQFTAEDIEEHELDVSQVLEEWGITAEELGVPAHAAEQDWTIRFDTEINRLVVSDFNGTDLIELTKDAMIEDFLELATRIILEEVNG